MTATTTQFRAPTNPEESPIKKERNVTEFTNLASGVLNKSRDSTLVRLKLLGREKEERAGQKIYDEDLGSTVSEEFTDRLRAFFCYRRCNQSVRWIASSQRDKRR
jgi:hypothetical protein